ncbi:uroporphyrinogen-III synthase [Chelatococcus sp. SYSU_G07232]|uniref:Uroporphyrinogen-III synthase n=1 Tax=Chelatococcus albus TaxID=3047466 RepID=A0ABT7ACE3_9HYPH|nr:uroporphyrinogen-III synthase [Chelatococcus sp. SYSU_G07232]MDJ1156998.1 uroporphyrinogen-III synthase [Chelatococcus sp. SYSU_G07232]
MAGALEGRRIVVPETRELALFASMLEEQGAIVERCPMIAIRDVSDPAPVEAWLARFCGGSCDDLILLTGEGLRRLLGFVRRAGMEEAFVAALGRVRKFARGPKPVRALREIGLNAEVIADEPTSQGVIDTLARHNLAGRRVGVQLYPDKEHRELLDAIATAGATADPILPYAYDPEAADARVFAVIGAMAAGEIDAIAFTSSGQVRRFVEVARAAGREADLRQAFACTSVAAVGPVVEEELQALGLQVDIRPSGDRFFMKPLVRAMAIAFADGDGPRSA